MRVSAAAGELQALQSAPQPDERDREEVDESLADWHRYRSPIFAAELVGSAISVGLPMTAVSAAQQLEAEWPQRSESLSALVGRVLGKEHKPSVPDLVVPEVDVYATRLRVRDLKRRLDRDPRNAIAWSDVAYEYVLLAQSSQAQRSMEIALALAPNNRHVLRSATRLFLYLDKPDSALALLSVSEATKRDPWLAAAELAVSGAIGRSPRRARGGIEMIESGRFSNRDLAELESAVGTHELRAGKDRRARQLFRSSLADPTENTVAQFEWASRRVGGLVVPQEALNVPIAFEARTQSYLARGDWEPAVNEAWLWHADEPFSDDAAIAGSYAAAVGMDDFQEAIRIANAGLRVTPGSYLLRQNLAYALIESGALDEGDRLLSIARRSGDRAEPADLAVTLANEGLLAIRRGYLDEGRARYLEAAEVARAGGRADMRAMALLKLCLEELRAGRVDIRPDLGQAMQAAKGRTEAGILRWRTLLDDQVAEAN